MSNHDQVRVVSTELASLWTQYYNDSLANCMLTYFLRNIDDNETKQLLENALTLCQNQIQAISMFFNKEQYPIPIGMTAEDVNLEAPRLFEDVFYLHYIKHMARFGLIAYSLALNLSFRTDIRSFYTNSLTSSAELDNRVTELMLAKGVIVRSPYIPPSEKIELAKGQDYLGSLFGEENRPLNAMEVSNLYNNIQTNIIGKCLVTAFSQVANSSVLRDYFIRGKEIADKHIQIFSSLLNENDLPAPATLGQNITRSTIAPFSEKLMLFHINALISGGMGNYGASISTSQRLDIAVDYARLMAEIGLYGEDGANLMIENGWLEEPPQVPNRTALARSL